MAAKFNDLVEYFEKLASEHKEIKHTEKDKHFYRFELDEVITGMCSKIKYPALIMEGYDFSYAESNSDNIRKKRSGAFWLIDEVKDIKDFDRIHEVWDRMETIGNDILIRMKADKESRQVPVMRDFNISDCDGIPLSVAQLGQHGVRFTFSLTSAVNNEMDKMRWM